MKRSIYNLVRRNLPAALFCLALFLVLVGPELMSSSSAAGQGNDDGVQPGAPAVNVICVAAQNLTPGPSFIRPSTTFTMSTGCNNDAAAVVTTGATTPYQAFAFNVSGCAAPISLTATVCAVGGCGSGLAASFDSVILVYQKDNGAPGVFGNPVFDPTNPTDNNKLRSGNNNACAPDDASVTVNICAGVFVVVVTSNGAGATGTFNLQVSTSNAACSLVTTPTVVRLDSFEAVNYGSDVSLEWKTGTEIDNLGFNVYREDGGKRKRINDQILAGSALVVGPGTELGAGTSYSWADSTPVGRNTRYWLEDLGLDGQSTLHGPFSVRRSAPGDRLPPARGRAQLLSKVGSGAQTGQTTPVPRAANAAPLTIASQSSAQPDLAARSAMKMKVEQEGWYRVGQPELEAAGFATTTDPRMLRMFVDGQEQAIFVTGEEDGRFDPSDSIEFYGLGLDSAYSNWRTYWLTSGSQPGLRIERVKGKGSRETTSSFPYTVERRDHSIYFAGLRNGDAENFFGAVVAREAVDQSINVQHLDPAGSGAELEVSLQGVTELSHRVRIELNGVEVGAMGFEGQAAGTTKIPLGRSTLREGQNIVRLTAFGGETDISLLAYIRITYPHTYTADDDVLRFSLSGKQQVSVGGFTSPAIRVLDVTDPAAVRQVSGRVQPHTTGYTVTVSAPKGGGERIVLAFAENKTRGPVEITLNRPSNLRQPGGGADLVIITHRDFLDSIGPLKEAREKQGFSVAVVDVEDIYDEFSFGQKTPQAVRDFLAYARSTWQIPPDYALLVGDASYDPKGYLGFGNLDFLPTKLIDTRLMETSSDDWFADFDEDGVPEIAVGRLTARTREEVTDIIGKLIAYDRSEPVDRVMLVTDSGEDLTFEGFSASLRSGLPQHVIVRQLDRGRMDPSSAEGEFVAGLDQGQKIVNYVGHGSIDQWRGRLLTSGTASTLTNSRHLPLFVMMTCLNGYFHDASLDSLGEALVKNKGGGAVAVWASSGMTGPSEQSFLNQQFLKLLLFNVDASLTLGEATVRAKSAVTDVDVRRTWILLGDPTMRLR